MKRRAIILMVTMTAALIVAGGVALAEVVICNATPPCYGTSERDDINGSTFGETIKALGGDDRVQAGGGNDTVYGSSGNDNELRGEGGNDTAYGGGGNDIIGADTSDTLGSTDRSYGGGGKDTIFAGDGNLDIIDCGKGKAEEVTYDDNATVKDTIKNCEIKHPE
jgi:Ca2+-binding RTX toxin-like protein